MLLYAPRLTCNGIPWLVYDADFTSSEFSFLIFSFIDIETSNCCFVWYYSSEHKLCTTLDLESCGYSFFGLLVGCHGLCVYIHKILAAGRVAIHELNNDSADIVINFPLFFGREVLTQLLLCFNFVLI